MKALLAALAAVTSVSVACSNDAPTATNPTTTTPNASPQRLLETLKDHGIELNSYPPGTGFLDDDATIKAGRGICDVVRNKGPLYDPVPVIKVLYKLSDESSRAFYKASRDNLCPDVAAYVPSPLTRPTPDTIPGMGTFSVGIEVQPGIYVSRPLPPGTSCVWLRLRDTNNKRDSVIDSGQDGFATRVTILPTDVAFESAGCETWQKIG